MKFLTSFSTYIVYTYDLVRHALQLKCVNTSPNDTLSGVPQIYIVLLDYEFVNL